MAGSLLAGVGVAWHDTVNVLEAHADLTLGRLLPKFAFGLLVAVYVYVPLHELLHAAGCIILGGAVELVEISPLFGGRLLARIFPFVSSTTNYAGRLAEFDVHGSDLRLVGTDLAPYLLTVLLGVPLLRRLRLRPNAWLLGGASVLALAPWMSLTGDYYEIGSVLVTRLLAILGHDWSALRSDDMLLICKLLWQDPASLGLGAGRGFMAPALVISSSFLLGLVLASLTYQLGGVTAAWCARETRHSSPVERG